MKRLESSERSFLYAAVEQNWPQPSLKMVQYTTQGWLFSALTVDSIPARKAARAAGSGCIFSSLRRV